MVHQILNDVLLPTAVFVLMLVTGTGMRVSQFRKVHAFRKPIFACLAAQLLLLPLFAAALIAAARPSEHVALGLMILAICPSGALSTVYVYIARGNAALSAVLTSIGTIIYALAFPLLARGGGLALGAGPLELSLPVGHMFTQFLAFLVLPVCLGVWLSWKHPQFVRDRKWLLDLGTIGLLVIVIAISVLLGWRALVNSLYEILMLSAAFTALAFAGGYAISASVASQSRGVCAIECAVRNIPIAILLAQGTFNNETIIGFFVGFFLVNAVIVSGFAALERGRNREIQC